MINEIISSSTGLGYSISEAKDATNDYVFFQFGKYLPPFGKKSQRKTKNQNLDTSGPSINIKKSKYSIKDIRPKINPTKKSKVNKAAKSFLNLSFCSRKITIGYNMNFQLLKTEYLLCQSEMKQLLERLLMKVMV